jgi:hypothetical protein
VILERVDGKPASSVETTVRNNTQPVSGNVPNPNLAHVSFRVWTWKKSDEKANPMLDC